MAEVYLPPPTIAPSGDFSDWLQTTAGLVISRAVDAEFIRKTTPNADPTNWPGYDDQGRAYTRGSPTGKVAGISTPLLVGGAILAIGLLVVLLKD